MIHTNRGHTLIWGKVLRSAELRAALAICMTLTAVSAGWSSLAGSAFEDVDDTHPSAEAISGLKDRGIIAGNPDGNFRPGDLVRRSELARIMVQAAGLTEDSEHCLRQFHDMLGPSAQFFTDVYPGDWYERDFCIALSAGIITGYDDNSARPEDFISFVETAAILNRTFRLTEDTDDETWFKPSVDALASRNAIPVQIQGFDMEIDRATLAEMVYRIVADISDRPSRTFDEIQNGIFLHAGPDVTDDSRDELLRLVNEMRAERGLHPFNANALLQEGAQLHAEDMQTHAFLSHTSSDGRGTEDRIRETGYLSVNLQTCGCKGWSYHWGEVVADQTSEPHDVLSAFMGSPVHRAILVSREFDEAGVGRSGDYWVIKTGRILLR